MGRSDHVPQVESESFVFEFLLLIGALVMRKHLGLQSQAIFGRHGNRIHEGLARRDCCEVALSIIELALNVGDTSFF